MRSDKIHKWLSDEQIAQLAAGGCRGITDLDVAAIRQGQAEAKMRSYSRRPKLYDEQEPSRRHRR